MLNKNCPVTTLSKVVSLGWHPAIPFSGSASPGEAAGISALVFLPQKQRLRGKQLPPKQNAPLHTRSLRDGKHTGHM